MENHELTQVLAKLCLGVTFDQCLTFIEHVENTRRKAHGALHRVSCFMSDVGGTQCDVGLMLCQAGIRRHMEMAYPVWCATSQNNLHKLDPVHHQSLQRALGVLRGMPTSALEILSGIMLSMTLRFLST